MTDERTKPPPLATGSAAPPTAGASSLEAAIGLTIRSLRKQRDMTGAELAGLAGISVGMLSKIENGGISPSLSTLAALAGALGVPIADFFAETEHRGDCSYVPAGKGVTIDRRGTKAGHRYELLGHALRGAVSAEPYLITLAPDAEAYTQFRHAGVEFIHMLTGRVAYRHGDTLYDLRPGDSLLFDSAVRHGPEELTELPATYLSVIIYRREE